MDVPYFIEPYLLHHIKRMQEMNESKLLHMHEVCIPDMLCKTRKCIKNISFSGSNLQRIYDFMNSSNNI